MNMNVTINAARTPSQRNEVEATVDFGVRDTPGQTWLTISIPNDRKTRIGITTHDPLSNRIMPEFRIDRDIWTVVAPRIEAYLNARLKSANLKASKFRPGENRVERLIGKEVMVLIYALQDAHPDQARKALMGWHDYRPEDLWWISHQIERTGPDGGWRRSILEILTG